MKNFMRAALCAAIFSTAAIAQQSAPAPAVNHDTPQQPQIAPPVHPITMEQTRALFNVAGTQAMLRTFAHQALAAQRSAAPEFVPESVWKELEDGLAGIDFATLLHPTYAKYLSTEDAAKAIAFYKTPEGQHCLQIMPMVMREAGRIGQQQGSQIAQAVFARHQQEIMDAKAKYDSQKKQDLAPPAPDQPTPPAATSKPAAPKN